MTDEKIVEQSSALLAAFGKASTKLHEFYAEHDSSEEDFRAKARELEREMWSAHSKWLRFAEENFKTCWG